MPHLSLKNLFRTIPTQQRGFPLDARIQVLAAQTINQDGDARRVVRFLNSYSLLAGLLQRKAFPSKPSDIRRTPRVELASHIAAIEYTAVSLLPHVEKLTTFEVLRDKIVPLDNDALFLGDELFAIEGKFGYSNWLAGQMVGNLPPHSPLQVKLVEGIRDDENLILTSLYIKERYALSCYSLAATDISNYINKKGYPEPLSAFLRVSIDPLPILSQEDIRLALSVASGLPAIDRWHLLLRCIQSLLVQEGSRPHKAMSSLPALIELFSSVPSVEGRNLLHELGHMEVGTPSSPALCDHLVDAISKGTSPAALGKMARTLYSLVAGLSDETVWTGNAAVLDRHALAASGTRLGGVFAAVTMQARELTERRALPAMRWLDLLLHPDSKSFVPSGNLLRTLRLSQVPSEHRDRYTMAAEDGTGGNHDAVVKRYDGAIDVSDPEQALLIDAFLESGLDNAAVAAVTEALLAEAPLLKRLPFHEVGAAVPMEASDDIALAVKRGLVAEACTRHGVQSAQRKRNDSLDDVLLLAAKRFPSELLPVLRDAGLGYEAISRFLRSICTSAIMDTVPVGRTTEELLMERISVLNVLRTIDPSSEKEYELESREVALAIAAKKEMATVDQQRVYVDVDGLSGRMAVQIADDHERYRRLARLDPRVQEAAALHKFVKSHFPDLTVLDMKELSRALTSETDGILLKMVVAVRDEFAYGREFGLDGYLSGGIRHGNLEALLREPFVKLDLLGTFWSSGRFKPPAIASVAADLLPSERDNVIRAFKRFAVNFQAIVDEVTSDWVRIDYSGGESRSFFDLGLAGADIRVIETRVQDAGSSSDFVDEVISYLLGRIDLSLETARERVDGELRRRLHEVHCELESDLIQLLKPLGGPLVDNLVAPARGSIDTAVDKLIDWFRRSESEDTGTVDPVVPIEVSASLMRNMYPNISFTWDLKKATSGARLGRRWIKPWVDIVHTLLMNAVKHGGVQDKCDIGITFTVSKEATILKVSNQLGESADPERVDADLNDAMQRLACDTPIPNTAIEGKSGFAKVHKWARVDLRCPTSHIAASMDDGCVDVCLHLPMPVGGMNLS
jgi:hypothetical protein